MTRKATPKKGKKAKPAKKPAKPVTVYIAVRTMIAANESFTEPDRVFASKAAAQKYADQLNRELRAVTNPFADDNDPDMLMSGGEDALLALLKKLGLTAPTRASATDSYIDWEKWWDASYYDITDAQRDAIWAAFDDFEWYKVKTTTVE